MTKQFLNRRRFLHGLGAVALVSTSGCSTLSGVEDSPPTIPAESLKAIVEDRPPRIPEIFPVDIEASYLDSFGAGIDAALAGVPSPFTSSEIPNGAIRQDLNNRRDRLNTLLETAAEAASSYEALRLYYRARGEAAAVLAGWSVIAEGVTREEVVDRTAEIDAARASFIDRWDYLGADPTRTTVVHSALEERVHTAHHIADVDESDLDREPENPITIADLAGELERGLAAIEEAAYLYDRHRASLTDPTDLHDDLEQAATSLVGTIETRQAGLPTVDPSNPSALVDRDIEDTPAAEVLEGLYWELDSASYPREELQEGRPAHAIRVAKTTLARLTAFASVREDIEAGASYAVESARDVRSIRSAAIAALSDAQGELDIGMLANDDLARLADRLDDVDRRISRDDGAVRAAFLGFEADE